MRGLRQLAVGAFFVFSIISEAQVSPGAARECSKIKSVLKEGDLIFLESSHKIFKNVVKTQNHWASHVGIVLKNGLGSWVVAESRSPESLETPICDFVNRAYETRLGVKRLKISLSEFDLKKIRRSARSRLGIKYNFGFDMNSWKMFCSKYVYEVFRESLGLEVGNIVRFRELIDQAADPRVIHFWRAWFVGFIPWERETIVPSSIYWDPNFYTVYYKNFN